MVLEALGQTGDDSGGSGVGMKSVDESSEDCVEVRIQVSKEVRR